MFLVRIQHVRRNSVDTEGSKGRGTRVIHKVVVEPFHAFAVEAFSMAACSRGDIADLVSFHGLSFDAS